MEDSLGQAIARHCLSLWMKEPSGENWRSSRLFDASHSARPMSVLEFSASVTDIMSLKSSCTKSDGLQLSARMMG